MHSKRYQIRIDEETLVALRRLAAADDRTMAAQIRHMIRQECAKRGMWRAKVIRTVAVCTPQERQTDTS